MKLYFSPLLSKKHSTVNIYRWSFVNNGSRALALVSHEEDREPAKRAFRGKLICQSSLNSFMPRRPTTQSIVDTRANTQDTVNLRGSKIEIHRPEREAIERRSRMKNNHWIADHHHHHLESLSEIKGRFSSQIERLKKTNKIQPRRRERDGGAGKKRVERNERNFFFSSFYWSHMKSVWY